MAALSIFKNGILGLSKSNCPSVVALRPRVSRVCFASASKYAEGQNADGKHKHYDCDEAISEPRDDVQVTMDRAKEKTREMKEKAKEHAEGLKEKTGDAADLAKERANEMHEKTKENLSSAAEKAGEMKDKAMDSAGKMAEKTEEQAREAKEKAKENLSSAAERARDMANRTEEQAWEAKEKAKGMAGKVADKAKETVGGAWGAAKGTTQKIKEAVVGKDEDEVDDLDKVGDLDDYVKDYEKKEGKGKVMDEDVVELRRRKAEEDRKY